MQTQRRMRLRRWTRRQLRMTIADDDCRWRLQTMIADDDCGRWLRMTIADDDCKRDANCKRDDKGEWDDEGEGIGEDDGEGLHSDLMKVCDRTSFALQDPCTGLAGATLWCITTSTVIRWEGNGRNVWSRKARAKRIEKLITNHNGATTWALTLNLVPSLKKTNSVTNSVTDSVTDSVTYSATASVSMREKDRHPSASFCPPYIDTPRNHMTYGRASLGHLGPVFRAGIPMRTVLRKPVEKKQLDQALNRQPQASIPTPAH